MPAAAAARSRSRPTSTPRCAEVVEPGVVEPVELGASPAACRRRGSRSRRTAAASCTSRSITQASSCTRRRRRASRATRLEGRPPPPRYSQLASSCATPPGSRCSPAVPDDRLDQRVADHPAVAVLVLRHAVAPRRDHERRIRHDVVERLAGDRLEQAARAGTRSLSIPFSSALSAASSRARAEMSVATTRSAWREACMAWMPHPVPRSSARSTGALQHQAAEGEGGAADAEHVVDRQSVAEGELAEVGDDPPVGRRRARRRSCTGAGRRRAPPGRLRVGPARARSAPSSVERGERVCERRRRATGTPEHEQLGEGRQRRSRPSASRAPASARSAGMRWPRCSASAPALPHSASERGHGEAGGVQVGAEGGHEGRGHCTHSNAPRRIGAPTRTGAEQNGAMIRRHAIVTGMVQGVGFRWSAREEAHRLGVTGFARNRARRLRRGGGRGRAGTGRPDARLAPRRDRPAPR